MFFIEKIFIAIFFVLNFPFINNCYKNNLVRMKEAYKRIIFSFKFSETL